MYVNVRIKCAPPLHLVSTEKVYSLLINTFGGTDSTQLARRSNKIFKTRWINRDSEDMYGFSGTAVGPITYSLD